MSQLIDFSNFKPKTQSARSSVRALLPEVQGHNTEDNFKLTLNILVHNNPNKITFTINEVAAIINVKAEFVRRRIKAGIIKATYFGDRPTVQITELARILTEGIK